MKALCFILLTEFRSLRYIGGLDVQFASNMAIAIFFLILKSQVHDLLLFCCLVVGGYIWITDFIGF